MASWFGTCGALLGAIGVAFGAFGAHGLKDKVEPRMLEIWSKATEYQLWHALALLAVFFWMTRADEPSMAAHVAGWSFFIGTLIFSGSLFILVLSGKTWLGAITPIGGTALIVGWVAFAMALAPS